MKFNEKPSKKAAVATATMVGGGVIGATLSKGISGLVPAPAATATADQIKSAKTKKTVIQLVVAAAAAYVGMAIEGGDTAADLAKGAAFGIAVQQLGDVVTGVASNNSAVQKLASNGTKTGKFVGSMFGLACPCAGSNEGLAGSRRRRRSLAIPSQLFEKEYAPFQEINYLQAAL